LGEENAHGGDGDVVVVGLCGGPTTTLRFVYFDGLNKGTLLLVGPRQLFVKTGAAREGEELARGGKEKKRSGR
jgi:hypothetical protein